VNLRDLAPAALEEFVRDLGQPRYRAEQLVRWLHGRGATAWSEMTDLPAGLREQLAAEEAAGRISIAPLRTSEILTAQDGTRKLALRTTDDRVIESVLIPDQDKLTLCVSSQVGCALDCTFCATATLGFGRQLSAGEIVDQVYRARALAAADGRRITNLVFMGMGEPLHNLANVLAAIDLLGDERGMCFSPRRITVSTAGLVPGIERLGQADVGVGLAISLNATTDAMRDQLMPINRKWNLAALLGAVRRFPLARRRRVTFEYVMLAGQNDTDADAARLPRLLRGIPAKVNLIPWNPHPAASYARPTPERVATFQKALQAGGLAVYVRRPRGDDIAAACGQLAARRSDATVPAVALTRARAGGAR
jgi:23S rRNA (adenine2503-C2)-methyltransferase